MCSLSRRKEQQGAIGCFPLGVRRSQHAFCSPSALQPLPALCLLLTSFDLSALNPPLSCLKDTIILNGIFSSFLKQIDLSHNSTFWKKSKKCLEHFADHFRYVYVNMLSIFYPALQHTLDRNCQGEKVCFMNKYDFLLKQTGLLKLFCPLFYSDTFSFSVFSFSAFS